MEDTLPEKSKTKKIDPVAIRLYGESFTGYQKVGEYRDLLPAFKDFYYTKKTEKPDYYLHDILREFNEQVCKPLGRSFFPYPSQIKGWRAKWDLDLKQLWRRKDETGMEIIERRNIAQIVKTRNEDNSLILGSADDNQLEAGVRTLGGELLNDAMQMLRDDQELEEIYDDEVLIKRRNYIVNVFAHATKLVHGKAALLLKASEEKRNNASFLMTLLAKATAGKLSDEEVGLLEHTYAQKPNEPQQPAHV